MEVISPVLGDRLVDAIGVEAIGTGNHPGCRVAEGLAAGTLRTPAGSCIRHHYTTKHGCIFPLRELHSS